MTWKEWFFSTEYLYQNNLKCNLKSVCQSAREKLLEVLKTKKILPFDKLNSPKIEPDDCLTSLDVKITDYIYSECLDSYIVFVNGLYRPDISNIQAVKSGLKVLKLDDCWTLYKSFLKNHFLKRIQKEKSPWALSAMSAYTDGIFIYVPENKLIDKHIQVLNIITKKGAVSQPFLVTFMGKKSRMTMSVENIFLESGYSNILHEQILNNSASLTYYSTSNKNNVNSMECLRADVMKNATIETFSLNKSFGECAYSCHINLVEESASAFLYGNWQLKKFSKIYYDILVNHLKPKTISRQHFKGALDDNSTSSFNGLVYIHESAQESDAKQLNNNLLMSNDAQAYSKPQLEVFADDVKATHGATFGSFDEEILFYFKSRGIDDNVAQKLFINGYNAEILEKIKLNSLKSTFYNSSMVDELDYKQEFLC